MTNKLPDCLVAGLNVVFVGTAAGERSAQEGAYYAHPGNKFWRTLAITGLTNAEYEPRQFRELVEQGIGFTDMCKTHAGMDRDIKREHYDRDGFRQKIVRYKPSVIAFTSKKASSIWLQRSTKDVEYGLQQEAIGSSKIFVLPSPSGAAAGHWHLEPWGDLAKYIGWLRNAKHPLPSQTAHSPE